MITCGDDCIICCDHCMYSIRDLWVDLDGNTLDGGAIGCAYHLDTEHQEIAQAYGHCDDFHCVCADEEGKMHELCNN